MQKLISDRFRIQIVCIKYYSVLCKTEIRQIEYQVSVLWPKINAKMSTDGLEWCDYLWTIVMFLSAVWTLILMAPIHCRGLLSYKYNI